MRLIPSVLASVLLSAVAVLPTSPATADPTAEVSVRASAPDRVLGQRLVVRYDVRGDRSDGDVRVVVRRVGGGYLDVWREPSYPLDGRIRIALARADRAGPYRVLIRWTAVDGSAVAVARTMVEVGDPEAVTVPEPPSAKRAATRLVAAANHDRVGVMRRIAVRPVVRDLRRDVRYGATLERGRCFGRGDEDWGDQLDGARRGCLVEATGEMTYELDVLQLALRDGRWRAVGLRVVALS